MLRLSRILLALGLTVLLAQPALAQRQKQKQNAAAVTFPPRARGSPARLLDDLLRAGRTSRRVSETTPTACGRVSDPV